MKHQHHGFMEWYVALFWEDCRYFCVSYQNNLMKGESFLCSVFKIIDSKSLLKSALTGKDAFDISSWSCLLKKFVVDKAFLSYVLELLQISFGLSIKGTHEIEWSKVTWWHGVEEFWEKLSFLYWMKNLFFACWLLIPEKLL